MMRECVGIMMRERDHVIETKDKMTGRDSMTLDNIRIWVAIVMLIDAAIGLWGESAWQRLCPSINIRRVALIEAAAALAIVAIHFGLRSGF